MSKRQVESIVDIHEQFRFLCMVFMYFNPFAIHHLTIKIYKEGDGMPYTMQSNT